MQHASKTITALEDMDQPEEMPVEIFAFTAPGMKIMLEETTNGDAAHWGDSTRRITGSFIAIEQREE